MKNNINDHRMYIHVRGRRESSAALATATAVRLKQKRQGRR